MDNLGGLCFIFLATGLLYSALGTYQLRGSWKTRQTDRRQSRRKLWIGLCVFGSCRGEFYRAAVYRLSHCVGGNGVWPG